MFKPGEKVWYTKPEKVTIINKINDDSYTIIRENGSEKETVSEFLSHEKPKSTPAAKSTPQSRKRTPPPKKEPKKFEVNQQAWYVKPGQKKEIVKIMKIDLGESNEAVNYVIKKENGVEKDTVEEYLQPLYTYYGGDRKTRRKRRKSSCSSWWR